jgi:two-component system OmpR family response regulator
VDDDPDVCAVMRDTLERDGYDVTTLSDPTQAVATLKRGDYHLVLLDLMMPGVDGLTVLGELRKVDPDIAVVIFTGYPTVDSAVESIKLDVSDYIRKPFGVDELRRVVERVIAKRGLQRDREQLLHQAIGANIRRVRKELTLTLRQMARRTGLSVSALSQIERAECSASVASLHRIASALGVRVATLFGDF